MTETLQNIDPLVWIIGLGAVVLLIVVAIVVVAMRRKRRTANFEQRYGREYQRTVDRVGTRKEAERELTERSERRRRFSLQPLSAGRRDELRSRWDHLQTGFVDAPAATVRNADVLLDEAARERGYPDSDVEQRLRDLALDHSDEVHAYRKASDRFGKGHDGGADDESSLRRRMVAGRDLFEALLESGRGGAAGTDGGTSSTAAGTTSTAATGSTRDSSGSTRDPSGATRDPAGARDPAGDDRPVAQRPPAADQHKLPTDER